MANSSLVIIWQDTVQYIHVIPFNDYGICQKDVIIFLVLGQST